jgi:hypothetical protein
MRYSFPAYRERQRLPPATLAWLTSVAMPRLAGPAPAPPPGAGRPDQVGLPVTGGHEEGR